MTITTATLDDPRLPYDRFWAHVVPEPNSGCWLWTGARTRAGYGIWGSRAERYAHRTTYKTLIGAIEPGLELDHLCRVPACCNPAHLEPVTHRENLRRSPIHGLWHPREKCLHGHDYPRDSEGQFIKPQRCMTCRRTSARAFYYRHLGTDGDPVKKAEWRRQHTDRQRERRARNRAKA